MCSQRTVQFGERVNDELVDERTRFLALVRLASLENITRAYDPMT